MSGDVDLPGISTDLRVSQTFGGGAALDDASAVPSVELDNITLTVGSAFGKVIGPILDKVNSFLAPIRPIAGFLGQEVPVYSDISQLVGSGPKTWLDAIATFSDDPNVQQSIDSIKKMIQILNDLDGLLQHAQALANDNVGINFGDYVLSGDLRNSDPNSLDPNSSGSIKPGTGFTKSTSAGMISDSLLQQLNGDSDAQNFLGNGLQNDDGIRFPIFEDPLNAIGMLFGKHMTLVTWDLPKFTVGANSPDELLGVIPVGPVPVSIEMCVSERRISAQVSIGFDSRGLEPGNTFMDGFFFQDSSPPVIDLNAHVSRFGQRRRRDCRGGRRGDAERRHHGALEGRRPRRQGVPG